LAISTFGGTAQFIVAWLIAVTHNPLAPAWYMALAVAAGLVAMIATRETAPVKEPLRVGQPRSASCN
jgi:thiazole synthase ThiGH ThiG subunit